MFTCFQKIPMKDFHAEIRAYKDVEDFLNRTLLILNLHKTGLTEIIDAMLAKLHEKEDIGSQFTMEEARQAIFTQDSGSIATSKEKKKKHKKIIGLCRSPIFKSRKTIRFKHHQ